MNEQILKTLEFDKIVNELKSRAATYAGKELATGLKPASAIEKVNEMQAETDEACQIFG